MHSDSWRSSDTHMYVNCDFPLWAMLKTNTAHALQMTAYSPALMKVTLFARWAQLKEKLQKKDIPHC